METEIIDKLFLELSQVTTAKSARELHLEELLRSCHCIAIRRGQDTNWDLLATNIAKEGIGSVTPRVYKQLQLDGN
jgi:hypothetical protein